MMPQRLVKPGKSAMSPQMREKGTFTLKYPRKDKKKRRGRKKSRKTTTIIIIIIIIMIIIFNEGGQLAIGVSSGALNNSPTRLEHTKHA